MKPGFVVIGRLLIACVLVASLSGCASWRDFGLGCEEYFGIVRHDPLWLRTVKVAYGTFVTVLTIGLTILGGVVIGMGSHCDPIQYHGP